MRDDTEPSPAAGAEGGIVLTSNESVRTDSA